MNSRIFVLVLGIVFLLVGVLGFVGPFVAPYSGPKLIVEKSQGDLLSLFPVNVLHDGVHILFGILGIAAFAAGEKGGRIFAQVVGVVYVALAVLGAVPLDLIRTVFGLIPIHDNDIWLHAVIGVVACYVGFAMPVGVEPAM